MWLNVFCLGVVVLCLSCEGLAPAVSDANGEYRALSRWEVVEAVLVSDAKEFWLFVPDSV